MSSDSRRIRQEAKSKPKFVNERPNDDSGKNGDTVYLRSGNGVEEFVKDEGRWLSLKTGRPAEEKAYITNNAQRRASFLIGSVSATPSSSASSGNHNLLSNLNDDDHSQYVHITSNRTISAVHTFNAIPLFNGGTSGSSSPFTVDSTYKVTNLNADRVDDKSPGTGVGDIAYYDANNRVVDSQLLDGSDSTAFFKLADNETVTGVPAFNGGTSGSSSPFSVDSTYLVSNLNADLWDGYQFSDYINQAVKTSSNVQFGDIIVDGDDITSNPFTSGFTGGGWKIDNTAHAEFSSASIRGTLSVYELLLQQLRATNGSVLITAVAKVESIDGSDITFEDPSDNGVCPFHTNDIVMVQRADLTGTSGGDNGGGTLNITRRLVRRVTSVSGRTITVTRDGDLPSDTGSFGVGDDVVRIGNTTNTNRDAVLYLSADDSKAPYLVIKDGVNSWANWGSASTEKARLGRLDGITDTDAGLSGSQSNLYGLYSDSVYLKGHIFATSGEIGGIKMASNKLYVGTGTYYNANTAFYLDSGGDFSLKDKLKWDESSSTLTITGNITLTNNISSSNISDVAAFDGTSGSISDVAAFDGTSGSISDVAAYTTNQDKQKISNLLDDSPSGTGFFMDANKLGYYTSSAFKTYMGKNGDFILTGTGGSGAGSLSWDSSTSTLAIAGNITIRNPGDIDISTITNDSGFTDDTAADAAQGTANTGVSNAATAQGTANTAVTNAATAQSTANTGVTNAATAQTAANAAQSTANGRNTSFYQDGIPTSLAAGDIWFDTNDGLKMYRARGAGDNEISGSEWVAVAGEGVGIGTLITGSGVYTGTLTAGQVNAVAIDAGSITAGTLTGRTVQTASTGQRVEMNSSNELKFYDSTGVVKVNLEGDTSYGGSLNIFSGGAIRMSNNTSISPSAPVSSSTYLAHGVTITNRGDYDLSPGVSAQVIADDNGEAKAGYFWCSNASSGSSARAFGLHVAEGMLVHDSTQWAWFGNYVRKVGNGTDGGVLNVRGYTTNDPASSDGQAIRIWDSGSGVNRWSINIDSEDDLSFRYNATSNGGWISNTSNTGQITFTGQHRCMGNSGMTTADYAALEGYIVSASGSYNQMNGDDITISEALPVIELSSSDNDKKVFGVVSGREGERREYQAGQFNSSWGELTEKEERIMINSLGEGAIWVTNLNGNLENGDYVTSSTAAGLGQKQDDDLLHNYTVAKITQDCDFSSGTEFEHGGQTYKKEFVGCTYHCG